MLFRSEKLLQETTIHRAHQKIILNMVFWQTNGESMSVDYVEESMVNSEMDDLSLAVKSFAARVKWVNLAQEVMPS